MMFASAVIRLNQQNQRVVLIASPNDESATYGALTVSTQPANRPGWTCSQCTLRNWYKWPVLFGLLHKYKERSKRIDVMSRLLFPVGFAVFNVFYWIVYLVRPFDYSESDPSD